MSGETYEMLERGLAPTAGEVRLTLIRLRQKLHWSRPAMAAFLGVHRGVLRSWEVGARSPSGAARRLIWLLGDRRAWEMVLMGERWMVPGG